MTISASPESYFFYGNGLRQHYWHFRSPGCATVIMLHGIRSYAKTWMRTAELLRAHFDIVALDLRGRGDSEWSAVANYYADDYVADIAALVDHLQLHQLILLGHSLGGQNALLYAAKHPAQVAALIVEDIGPGSSSAGAGAVRIVREFENTPEQFDSWQEATQFWRSIRPHISDASLRQRVLETLTENADGKIRWSYDFAGIKKARLDAAAHPSKIPDLWPAVRSLACPTLVLRGENSDYLSRDTLIAMANSNPRIEIAEVPGATHYVHDDNFSDFYQRIDRFLDPLKQRKQE